MCHSKILDFKKITKPLVILFCLILISCSNKSPPDSVLNSIVIARSGIDDFGGLKVINLIDTLEKYTEKEGGNVIGWSERNGEYLFTMQQPNSPAGSLVFRPIDDDTVFIYSLSRPNNPTALIQTINFMHMSVYPPRN